MKAIVCKKPGELTLTDVPKPNSVAGEVLVKIECIGICGTDLHIFSGRQPFVEYPRIMGHELSATVISSPGGCDLRPGTPVIINPYIACGKCVACRKNKPNCCSAINVLGVHQNGGMCEYLSVPETALIHAGTLSINQAAMVEFLAIGAHACSRGKTGPGDRVLVVGLGPIGLGVALFARLAGAEVTVMDNNTARVTKAQDIFDFKNAVIASNEVSAELSQLTNGDFFDLVFDATGNAKAIEVGFQFVAHGGTTVLVSIVKDNITFSDTEFHKREMCIVGSRNATLEDFKHVIQNIENGNIPTDKFFTHSCKLEDVPQMLPVWAEDPDNVIKAIVKVT
ncbi:MAG: dehydrogenase [Alphaproteobacteria bacterium]|nr:MAG: dehydrogenase [Alphaproteobacteria bacterium]